jgi:hypothetical protein
VKPKLPVITMTQIRARRPCYDPCAQYGVPANWQGTVLDVLLDKRVLDKDKLWLVHRDGMLPDTVYREHAWRTANKALKAERKAGREPHKDSWAAVKLARRMAEGKAVTEAERNAAWSAAWNAAWSAAGNAAWSAAWGAAGSAAGSAAESAAGNAAWSAAGSAAWSAAESAQVELYVKLVKRHYNCRRSK